MLVDTFIVPPNTFRPTNSDFHGLILPVIAGLAAYHTFMDLTTQKKMIEALKSGFISRKPRICVQTLTVMLLEMPDILTKHLPEILLDMSKMTTSVSVAIPVLEFLSTLSRLPNHRFANFVMVQYMYVFAMSLPYTNPFRYDHYTVSLAHHVIAGWFLKCRLPFRRNLVNYIIAVRKIIIYLS
jgi:tuberous sclerosis protein 2